MILYFVCMQYCTNIRRPRSFVKCKQNRCLRLCNQFHKLVHCTVHWVVGYVFIQQTLGNEIILSMWALSRSRSIDFVKRMYKQINVILHMTLACCVRCTRQIPKVLISLSFIEFWKDQNWINLENACHRHSIDGFSFAVAIIATRLQSQVKKCLKLYKS